MNAETVSLSHVLSYRVFGILIIAILGAAGCANTVGIDQPSDYSPEKMFLGKKISIAEYERLSSAFSKADLLAPDPLWYVPTEYQDVALPQTVILKQLEIRANRTFALLEKVDEQLLRVELHLDVVPNIQYGKIVGARWKGLKDRDGQTIVSTMKIRPFSHTSYTEETDFSLKKLQYLYIGSNQVIDFSAVSHVKFVSK